jgi:signal peptidase II
MTQPKKKRLLLAIAIIVAILVIDQVIKILVKTHMHIGESIPVFGSWFQILFVENEGMAFGISFGENIGKLCLTLFRVGVVGLLIYYLHKLIKSRTASTLVTVIFSMIIAGALGNIIDCVCYGKIFGYADWFFGKVVDMFYFPLIRNSAGEVLFFRPVFNFADSCITCAVIVILLFYMKELNGKKD